MAFLFFSIAFSFISRPTSISPGRFILPRGQRGFSCDRSSIKIDERPISRRIFGAFFLTRGQQASLWRFLSTRGQRASLSLSWALSFTSRLTRIPYLGRFILPRGQRRTSSPGRFLLPRGQRGSPFPRRFILPRGQQGTSSPGRFLLPRGQQGSSLL